jgi:pimeloyl-ACP methyl ester carboxylesterase
MESRMSAHEFSHKTRDVHVRLLRAGHGRMLVFLHGAGGFPGWTIFLETLSAQFDVLAPEHPGFGNSDNPQSIRSVSDMAMYYLDFLDGLDAEQVHLVGHSLGGWIAAELAVRNSNRLASLVLIAPAGIRVRGVPAGDNFIWSPEETVRNLYHDQSLAEQILARTLTEQEAELALKNRFMAAKLGWEPRWFNPALERWLHRLQLPTLVLWGENDKLLPSRYAALWGERVPEAKVEVIPACGHLPHVEKADLTARKISEFIAGK